MTYRIFILDIRILYGIILYIGYFWNNYYINKVRQMTEKQKRLKKILDLIALRPIGTQEVLNRALKEVGISTTQSTLSKDMKELGIIKVSDNEGKFRYQVPTGRQPLLQGEELLRRELTYFVTEVDSAENILVIKSINGHAQGLCEAIDQVGWPGIVGTLAGENTIFILCRSKAECQTLRKKIMEITGEL